MDASQILLVILGIMLAVFLTIGIVVLWNVYMTVKQFRPVGESAKNITKNFHETSNKVKDNASKISIAQVLSEAMKNRKR